VIEPWSPSDHVLLAALLGDPAMMEHLGGPETAEKIAERQKRYEQPGSLQFRIVDPTTGEGAGWVGAWERDWRDMRVYEVGWSVVPPSQGRGLATGAMRELLTRLDGLRFVHAFPSVDNAASNAVCRKLGFELLEVLDYEYPPGTPIRVSDWRYDLGA
jgi:RimJ/RimL family protein N-acetyltransferase